MAFQRSSRAGIVALAIAITSSIAATWVSAGDQQSRAAVVEDLRLDLLELDARYQGTKGKHRDAIGQEMKQVAAARENVLAQLARIDPAAAMAAGVLADVRDSLSRPARRHVEEIVEEEGVLDVFIEDRHDGSDIHRELRTTTGEVRSLHFAGAAPELESGTRVRVRGMRVKDVLALDASGVQPLAAPLAAALPRTLGAQRTLVILVNFRDNIVQPYTVSSARSIVFDTTSAFYLENSFQQTWLEGDVVGWFTIPVDSTTCSSATIASYARSAAAGAGADLASYSRFVYAFPRNACTWWGLGSVGGSPSSAWVNGTLALQVVAHELGHNFGLYHANAQDCGPTAIGTSCTSIEYGDTIDDMGQFNPGHFNAFAKERLGWLNTGASPPIATVTSGGSYAIGSYQIAGQTQLAVKILKATDPATGARTWYYLEYRRPIGFDAFLASNANVTNGITVHSGSEASGNSSYLLDMTPATVSWSDPALTLGKTFHDASQGLTVVPAAIGTNAATVSVSFGTAACVHVAPTVAVSPSVGEWVVPGMAVAFTVTVTNNDSASCAPSSLVIGAAVPDGWSAMLDSTVISLAAGATDTTSLTVTAPAATVAGSYPISVTVAGNESGLVTGASATYRVLSGLAASVAADRASYRTNQSVTLTARVWSDVGPIAAATVVFRITRADGSIAMQTASTGSNGAATTVLRLRKKEFAGVWTVLATATPSTRLTVTATTSFAVR